MVKSGATTLRWEYVPDPANRAEDVWVLIARGRAVTGYVWWSKKRNCWAWSTAKTSGPAVNQLDAMSQVRARA
jgi:hypothetical protein